MKVATRRLLEEQLVVVAVLGSGKMSDAMWDVPQEDHRSTLLTQRNKEEKKETEEDKKRSRPQLSLVM